MVEINLIETSMSAVDTFSRCRKKYEFQEVRGWLPRSSSWAMEIGTLYHAAQAAGLNAVRMYDEKIKFFLQQRSDNVRAMVFLDAATKAIREVTKDRDGKLLGLSGDDRILVGDMIDYWFERVGELDLSNVEEVVSVEEPLYIQIGKYIIRCTLDAVLKYCDQDDVMIVDHKTGDPKTVKAWIRLDNQTSIYYVGARGKYGKVVNFHHSFMNRKVPPGSGHNPLTTKSGQKRSAATLESMQDQTKYVGSIYTTLSNAQLDAHTRELVENIQDIEHCKATGIWSRTKIKIGPMSCDKCPYFEPCQAERDGMPPEDDGLAGFSYLVRGSDEWNDLQAGKLTFKYEDEKEEE